MADVGFATHLNFAQICRCLLYLVYFIYLGSSSTVVTFPSVDEVVKTDAFPTAIWQLEPHREGMLPVAAGRGGPLNIHWEVHGDGPIKLILIQGLGVLKSSWQRQTVHFGHVNGDQYSVLLLDNRGMGRSDRPMMRYSTSAMAADILEVLDHLSWTDERQLHVCGISNSTVAYTARNLFPIEWLTEPDDVILPDETVPRCRMPIGGWPYRRFESNYARFIAQEITKKRDHEGFTRSGFLLQVIACGWHYKSAAQLRGLGDKIGRQRILVIHGTEDKIISVPHGRKLIEYLQPGKSLVVDGMGRKFLALESPGQKAKVTLTLPARIPSLELPHSLKEKLLIRVLQMPR
ncbi:hypothetical protein GQX73_g850 [Xylaria multiplex]|uniref:AB hydrolase-1 domain-containing protein n=1 Tax=Xylaria multiplex TaxID=323545 RepID=A0A7C8MYW8_9PEZI|nr:hypothetical protein GQX73_g850 [Xylaria multiplex]